MTLECDRLDGRQQSCNYCATLQPLGALSAAPIPSPHSRELPEFSRAQLHVQLTREACSPCPTLLTPSKLQGALEQPNFCSHGRPENRLIWDGPRKTACLLAGTGAAIVDDGPMASCVGPRFPPASASLSLVSANPKLEQNGAFSFLFFVPPGDLPPSVDGYYVLRTVSRLNRSYGRAAVRSLTNSPEINRCNLK